MCNINLLYEKTNLKNHILYFTILMKANNIHIQKEREYEIVVYICTNSMHVYTFVYTHI